MRGTAAVKWRGEWRNAAFAGLTMWMMWTASAVAEPGGPRVVLRIAPAEPAGAVDTPANRRVTGMIGVIGGVVPLLDDGRFADSVPAPKTHAPGLLDDDEDEGRREAGRRLRSRLGAHADRILQSSDLRAAYVQAKRAVSKASRIVEVPRREAVPASGDGGDPLFAAGIDVTRGISPVVRFGDSVSATVNPWRQEALVEMKFHF